MKSCMAWDETAAYPVAVLPKGIKAAILHRADEEYPFLHDTMITVLGGKLFGSANITAEREAEIISAPDRHRLTWRFKTTTGLERTHSYYFLETNKDYITINGDGGFYVISSTVQKYAEDALKVYNGEKITADSPYTTIDQK